MIGCTISRPIASGAVSRRLAFVLMSLCWQVAILSIYLFPWRAIVDVFIIAAGYVLRIVAGGMATCVSLSHWMVLMTFLLALFLAFAKRRDDVVMFEETNVKARNNVDRYNLSFMNQVIGIIASITMVCYIMYTVSPEVTRRFHSPFLYATSIFVLSGIIRYLQITIVEEKSASPTKLLFEDRFLQITILGWLLSFIIIIYVY